MQMGSPVLKTGGPMLLKTVLKPLPFQRPNLHYLDVNLLGDDKISLSRPYFYDRA